MDYVWIFGAAVLLMFLFSRVRTRRAGPRKQLAAAGPRIQGFQLAAFVHPRMSAQCLFDDRVQFGEGFRRKGAPPLPHDDQCRCQTVPFSFASSEVFKGALRGNLENQCTIPDLPPKEISRLIGRLKAVEGEGLPESGEDYLQKVDLSLFPPKNRHDIEGFLKERHQFFAAPEQGTDEPVETLEQEQPARAGHPGQAAE
ncbi:MAG: hypothetical protein V3S64_15415 [bacterium]